MPWQQLTASQPTRYSCAVTASATDSECWRLQHRHNSVHHLWLASHADGHCSFRPRELEEDIGDAVQVSALEGTLGGQQTGNLGAPGEAEVARVRYLSAVPSYCTAAGTATWQGAQRLGEPRPCPRPSCSVKNAAVPVVVVVGAAALSMLLCGASTCASTVALH